MKDFLKRVLSRSLQRVIYRHLWNPVRDAYWAALKLDCTLASGLRIEVRNRSDWTIYNEIMVNGEYDLPIERALDGWRRGGPFHVLDLGGNVGYFTFRCADRFLRRWPDDEQFHMTVVEGSPAVFADLKRRVDAQAHLARRVTLHHGLVGLREGTAYIGDSHIHYSNTISARAQAGAIRVPFINLTEVLRETEEIDLLKCDIEGAEFELIENYEDLLRKVRAAVFEFHRYGRDIERFRTLLQGYGFAHRNVLRETPTFSIEFYTRDQQSS